MSLPAPLARLAKVRQTKPHEWTACCPAHDDKTPSLSITETDGGKLLWHCHAGCSQEAVQDALGGESRRHEHGEFHDKDLGEPSAAWRYRAADGRVLGVVARYETGDGKTVRPWKRNGIGWKQGAMPVPRPLYNLDKLAANSTARVLIVEGEKCADAAGRLFPEMIATTWPGGCKAVRNADLSPLKSRDVILWPDADAPGRAAMLEVQRAVGGHLIEPPAGKPEGWDVADATLEEARELLRQAAHNRGSVIVGAERSRPRTDLFDRPPEPPPMIVAGFEPRDAGAMPGAGGAGKTTLELTIAVQTILGWSIFGTLDVLQPGPVLFVTAEDGRERIEYRLHRICQAYNLGQDLQRRVLNNLHIEDLSATRARLVQADAYGNLMRTPLADQIAEGYRGRGLARIVFDPVVFFGPGERFVNDGEAEVMHAGRFLAAELRCAVKFLAHVGKANARGGSTDQYAGRGGSALADNGRFVHVLALHTGDSKELPPAAVKPAEIANGHILRLHVAKLTDAIRPPAPIWLRRTGWRFDLVPVTASDPEAIRTVRVVALRDFVAAELDRGIRHSRNTLEGARDRLEFKPPRAEVRELIHEAVERGHLVELERPAGERRRGPSTFLQPASARREA